MWDESRAQKWLDVSGPGWANDEAALPRRCWEGPDPPVVPQKAATVLHGCDTSLCKLFRTAETCLLWLLPTLCAESSPEHTHFTCWCCCFISGQICSRWWTAAVIHEKSPGWLLQPVSDGPKTTAQFCCNPTFPSTFSDSLDDLHIWHQHTTESMELRDRPIHADEKRTRTCSKLVTNACE